MLSFYLNNAFKFPLMPALLLIHKQVRNEKAEDFLAVIQEWEKLCQQYGVENESLPPSIDSSDDEEPEEQVPRGEFEVGRIVGICYGKTENLEEVGLKFKV